jgi:hypothetical protein
MEPEEIAKHITEDIHTNCGLKNSIKPKFIPKEKPYRDEELYRLAAIRASYAKLPVPYTHPLYNTPPIKFKQQEQPIPQPKPVVLQEGKTKPKPKINLPGKRKISL